MCVTKSRNENRVFLSKIIIPKLQLHKANKQKDSEQTLILTFRNNINIISSWVVWKSLRVQGTLLSHVNKGAFLVGRKRHNIYPSKGFCALSNTNTNQDLNFKVTLTYYWTTAFWWNTVLFERHKSVEICVFTLPPSGHFFKWSEQIMRYFFYLPA